MRLWQALKAWRQLVVVLASRADSYLLRLVAHVFGWSLYDAQRINEKRMSEAEGLAHSTLVNDMATVVEIDPLVPTLYHFVYVDNLGEITLQQ